jgi:hypothetical protein
MTMDNSTPGSTPPPTWASDPAADLATPPAAAAPGQPGSSFAATPLVAKTTARNRASTGTALLLVGALVAIGGVAFAVGRVTAPAATTTAGIGAGRGTGTGAGGTGFGGAGGFGAAGRTGGAANVSGTVVSVSATSIQIKLATGSTVTLNLASNVTYRDATTGSAADVTPGATVEVGLAFAGGGTGPTASGNPRPSGGFGGAGLGNTSVGTITVVKP